MVEYYDDTLDLDLLVGDSLYNYYEMDYGYADTTSAGVIGLIGGDASYSLGVSDQAMASAVTYGGWGSWTGVAKVGKQFSVVGSSAKEVNFNYIGYVNGLLSAAGSASCSVDIRFRLENLDTGEGYDIEILSDSEATYGWDWKDFKVNETADIILRPGYSYLAFMRLQSSVNATVLGEAGSDFGPADGDDETIGPTQGVRFGQLLIRP